MKTPRFRSCGGLPHCWTSIPAMFYPVCSKDGNLNGPEQRFVFYLFNVGHAENLSEMEQNCRLLWSAQSDSCELPVMAQSLWTPAAKMGSRGADALKLLGVGDKKKTKKKERDNQEFGWVLSIKNEEWTVNTFLEKWQGGNKKRKWFRGVF